jgi:hypothetical protein
MRLVRSARVVATVALLGYFAVCTLTLATTAVDPYDASYHTVLARNLAFTGQYGVWDYGSFVVSPSEVTVGPTVILPVALGFRLFGSGPFVPNVAAAAVSIALVAALWWLVTTAVTSLAELVSALVAFVLMIAVAVQPFFYFHRPYGEPTAALLCAVATILALAPPGRRRLWLGGFVAGLAVDAKLLALVPVLCLAAGVVLLPAVGMGRWRALATFAAGFLTAFLVCAALSLWLIGSFGAFVEHWRELWRLVATSPASGISRRSSLAERLPLHARLLGGYVAALGVPLAIALFAWPMVVWRAFRAPSAAAARVATVLGADAVLIMAWWLVLEDQQFTRHAVIGVVLWVLYTHFALTALIAGPARRVAVALVSVWVVLVAGAWTVSPAGAVRLPRPATMLDPRTAALFQVADEIRRISVTNPAARFWTSGWWRHWDVQTLVDVRFANIAAYGALHGDGNEYVVTSDVFDLERNPRVARLLRDNADNVVFRNRYFSIYGVRHPLVGIVMPQAPR